jgi:hypothetical protein
MGIVKNTWEYMRNNKVKTFVVLLLLYVLSTYLYMVL